jgi:hypothetical protein
MTHSYLWHDSFTRVTRLVRSHVKSQVKPLAKSVCDMTHCYVWHDLFPCVTLRTHMSPYKSWSGSAASTMRAIFLGHLEQYRVLQFFDIENETSSVCHELKDSSIWRLWTIFSALYCAFHHPLSVLLFTDSGRVWVRASAIFFLASRPELSGWPRAV